MKSYNESTQQIEYKSLLELKSFIFCDNSSKVQTFSIEPFAIKYIKNDNKIHRYFPDLLIKFTSGDVFLVEVKSYSETIMPKKPKKVTTKSEKNYLKALQTYSINNSKWKAAKKFCEDKNIRFILLTEKQLH